MRRKKRSKQDKIYDGIIFVILTIIFAIVAYPLYFIIISSISNPEAVSSGKVFLFPVGLTFDGYMEVFKNAQVVTGFVNSLFYTFCGVMLNLTLTLPTAYALSRNRFGGKKIVTLFYVITMFVNGGMIPTYLVVKNLHLLDSMFALILPGALGVYNMIVARTFFKMNISEELYDAAAIDGCAETKFFFKIALPLSKAIIAIMVLYYGVGHWNSYFSSLLYMKTESKFPLQLVLRSILVQNQSHLSQTVTTAAQQEALEQRRQLMELMKYSLIIVSSLPVLIMYPLVQKHFVKGVMIGSIKG
ncbi:MULTISPECIES: carbohydrate ABC transporter permease [Vallitalea]|uniref:Carbohydrate ABC transporter permease n=2 Tax=Vallitalea TaxID=1348611 RepID=A0A8J8MBB3_9FIRM|nr:carbohydrate ABC transporter permease [Vallitalea guaymasensis]QUH29763.1 carbohydrate ABC transporter permease [Vallitalea guaymasensis]GMQ64212.1 carbohydrate ABC transporter permease [Vallitalea sp. AN17-2]